jgi:hypothetical protein
MDRPADTSTDAASVQLSILQRLTGSERVAMAFQMSDEARALTEAGIRYRHPDWTDQQVQDALHVQMLGPELAGRVHRGPPSRRD